MLPTCEETVATLRRGDKGQQVRRLKDYLKGVGMIMTGSDAFDLVTDVGVRVFQEKIGLEKDGLVGPKTWAELETGPVLFTKPTRVLKWIAMTPYYPQRDNEYHPGGTCNVTSLAMVLAYHGVAPADPANQLEDELFQRLQKPDAITEFERSYPSLKKMGYKPRHVHGMLGWLAKERGFGWKFSESTTRQEMSEFGQDVGPMIISGSFTRAGHIVTMVGQTIVDDLIVHDPWGDWNSGYRDRNGKYRVYNREDMEKVLSGRSATRKRTHRITP